MVGAFPSVSPFCIAEKIITEMKLETLLLLPIFHQLFNILKISEISTGADIDIVLDIISLDDGAAMILEEQSFLCL